MNKYISYRPEIDGLRAIAVLSVVFYHSTLNLFDQKFLPGGFIGVDIFFVISGYLISKIIFNEIEKTGKFSFINFYKRRVKRIIPALFFVILATFPFIYFTSMPNFFIDYAKSIISIVFFVSNLFFWNTSLGYDQIQNIQFQPFLHAWTLSLEEQFYFIFPLIFFFILKKLKSNLILILSITFFISLFLTDYMSYTHASINFYSLPTRAWEFLAGSIVMILEKKKINFLLNEWLNSLLVIFGFILIIYSFLFFNDKMYLPSLLTLIPVVGTSLIIFFSRTNSFLVKILSLDLFKGIGLISYSLYLWHYPIFIIFPKISLFIQLIIIFILSIFSYFFIEKKFRISTVSKFYSLKTIFVSGILILFISTISISIKKDYNFNNYPLIIKDSLIERGIIKVESDTFYEEKLNLNKRNLFIVGDSHMFVLYNALKKQKKIQNYNLITQNLSGGCYYVHGFNKINYFTKKINSVCNEANQEKRKINFLEKKDSVVIIGGRLPTYLYGDNVKIKRYKDKKSDQLPQESFIGKGGLNMEEGVKKSIYDLLNQNVKVILIYPVPVLDFDPPKKIFDSYIYDKENFYENLKDNSHSIPYDAFMKYAEKSHKLLNSIQHPNVYKIFTHNIICNKQKNICKAHDEKEIFYRDNNHLSLKGNNKLMPHIFQKLNLIENDLSDRKNN